MPVPVEFLRGVAGVLSLFFAYMAGRSFTGVRKGRVRLSRFYAWLFRLILCVLALSVRHNIDTIAIAVWTLDAVLFVAGVWEGGREKKAEDLTHEIFPDENT
jgi:hypothetical protein